MIDLESLLGELSAEKPCGDNLEYDPAYLDLLEKAKGTPEVVKGQEVLEPARDPDWTMVHERSLELLGRTKDIQIALYLGASLVKIEGLTGFRDGLALIRGMLERFWEHVHPQLDPDDPDPMSRRNLLIALSPQSGHGIDQSPLRFQQRLKDAPLFRMPQRVFCYNDVLAAREAMAEGGPKMSDIEAAFATAPADQLEAAANAIEESSGHLKAIQNVFTEKAGVDASPDLDGTLSLLREIGGFVGKYRASAAAPAAADEAAALQPGAPARAAAAATAISGEITSPEDVLRVLDKICRYYEINEPSSPVPLLLQRAKRLVSRNFMDIIKDLTPDALKQIEFLSGAGAASADQ